MPRTGQFNISNFTLVREEDAVSRGYKSSMRFEIPDEIAEKLRQQVFLKDDPVMVKDLRLVWTEEE